MAAIAHTVATPSPKFSYTDTMQFLTGNSRILLAIVTTTMLATAALTYLGHVTAASAIVGFAASMASRTFQWVLLNAYRSSDAKPIVGVAVTIAALVSLYSELALFRYLAVSNGPLPVFSIW